MYKRKEYIKVLLWVVLLSWCVPMHAVDTELGQAVTLKTKGNACYEAGQYNKALEYFADALEKAKEEEETHIYYACIGNIGNVYATIGDYKRALHYYLMGIEATKRSKNIEMQWRYATNIVAVYCLMGDVKNAKVFFNLQNSLAISNIALRRYYFLNNQAFIAQAEKNYKMAEYFHHEALNYANDKGLSTEFKASQISELGNIEMERHDYGKAIAYYQQAKDSAQLTPGRSQLIPIYKHLSDVYTQAGQPDSAVKYKNLYLSMSDSVFNVSQFNVAGSKLFEYENKENQQQIDRLTSQNSLQLIVIAVFLVLVIALVYLYVALRKKTNGLLDAQRLLISKNQELMLSEQQSRHLLGQYVDAKNLQQVNDTRQQSTAQSEQPAGETETTEEATTKDRRSDIGLDEEQRNRLLNSILAVLEDVSVISRSDFSLANLAEMVGSNTKYVSWVINDTYNKNFKTLLGEYRIREACKRLSDREHYANVTMQAIYEEVGFNSAASFIQAFKKVNGMTPSTYQRLSAGK